jgi:hypothetical protein
VVRESTGYPRGAMQDLHSHRATADLAAAGKGAQP